MASFLERWRQYSHDAAERMFFVALDIDPRWEDFSSKSGGSAAKLMKILCHVTTDRVAVRYKKRQRRAGGLKLHPSFFSAALKPYTEPLGPSPNPDEVDALRGHITLMRWLLCPTVPIIFDAKALADTKRTNAKTLEYAFRVVDADAITVNPAYGTGRFEEFLRRYPEKHFFLLCYPSVRDTVFHMKLQSGNFLWEHIALSAKNLNSCYGNVGLVVGATAPAETMRRIRALAGQDVVMLMPGLGAQGGSIRNAIRCGASGRENPNIILCAGDSVVHAKRGPGYDVAAEQAVSAYVGEIKKELKRLEAKKP